MDVSIIIPSLNRKFLAETIESVQNQTVLPIEILINFESGFFEKANKLIAQSRGEAFILLSDDDKLKPDYIAKTTQMMLDKKADIVATGLQHFGENEETHFQGRYPCFTTLYRKSIWEKVGGYDPSFGAYADGDFGMRCQAVGKRVDIWEHLFLYRVHEGNMNRHYDLTEDYKKFKAKYP